MIITFKKFGNWAGVQKDLNDMPQRVHRLYYEAQRSLGQKIVRAVKAHIRNQDLDWVPLAANTVKRKGHDDIYLDTQLYYDSIESWWDRVKKTTYVGIKAHYTYPSGKSISWVAAMNEYGLGKAPRRPIWNPTIDEFGGKDGLRDYIAEYISRGLTRKLGGAWNIDFKKNKIIKL